MKNIISNNCTAGFIYKQLGIKYSHPFIWSTFTYYNFNKILSEYKKIKYNKFEITETLLSQSFDNKKWKDTFTILVDNGKLSINYIHHHQNIENKEIVRKNGVDLYYYDMKNYVKELYKRRVKRMTRFKINDPIFVFCKTIFYTDEEFYNITYKPTKYKKIVCLPHGYGIEEKSIPKNTYIINLPEGMHLEPDYAEYLIKNYSKLLEL